MIIHNLKKNTTYKLRIPRHKTPHLREIQSIKQTIKLHTGEESRAKMRTYIQEMNLSNAKIENPCVLNPSSLFK
jgi:hypothetical protein